jgi:hypothetical protein
LAQELRAALAELGVELSKKGMRQLMKKFDADGSGAIELEEFRAMLHILGVGGDGPPAAADPAGEYRRQPGEPSAGGADGELSGDLEGEAAAEAEDEVEPRAAEPVPEPETVPELVEPVELPMTLKVPPVATSSHHRAVHSSRLTAPSMPFQEPLSLGDSDTDMFLGNSVTYLEFQ